MSDLATELFENVACHVSVHDEPALGVWWCGHCPYMNSGPVCTKCGGMRFDGAAVRENDKEER